MPTNSKSDRKSRICFECGVKEKDGRNARCKDCLNQYRRNSRDKEHVNARQRAYYHRIGFKHRRKYSVKSRYKLTEEEYFTLINEHDNRCGICGKHQSELPKVLSVDHDHSCCPGAFSCGDCVRGLLCSGCNLSLGGFNDDINMLQLAIEYLQKYKGGQIV